LICASINSRSEWVSMKVIRNLELAIQQTRRRRPRAGVKGTSFAAGLPARAMMISSPASARSTSFDNSVFA
jgi:hypothetical protein